MAPVEEVIPLAVFLGSLFQLCHWNHCGDRFLHLGPLEAGGKVCWREVDDVSSSSEQLLLVVLCVLLFLPLTVVVMAVLDFWMHRIVRFPFAALLQNLSDSCWRGLPVPRESSTWAALDSVERLAHCVLVWAQHEAVP